MVGSNLETLEELHTRHKKEAKDLQGRTIQKKKGATKKTRKGVNSECEDMERQLKERHAEELASLNPSKTSETVEESEDEDGQQPDASSVAEGIQNVTISEPAEPGDGQPKKRNRAKERLARRAAETAAVIEEAKKEVANQPNPKEIEHKKMQAQFELRGLIEKRIPPDGHCLFNAVADQLSLVGIPLGGETESKNGQNYKAVRRAAAGYMEDHPDDFAAFLEEPLKSYVEKIRDTAEWGGHLELQALAKSYKVEICVIQDGEAQSIKPDESAGKDVLKIWLGYYRHGFGLGEHYNSLRKSP